MSDLDNSYDEFDEQPSSGGGNNRNFMIAIISIIVVFVIIVVAVGGIYLLTRSSANSKAPLIAARENKIQVLMSQSEQEKQAPVFNLRLFH